MMAQVSAIRQSCRNVAMRDVLQNDGEVSGIRRSYRKVPMHTPIGSSCSRPLRPCLARRSLPHFLYEGSIFKSNFKLYARALRKLVQGPSRMCSQMAAEVSGIRRSCRTAPMQKTTSGMCSQMTGKSPEAGGHAERHPYTPPAPPRQWPAQSTKTAVRPSASFGVGLLYNIIISPPE